MRRGRTLIFVLLIFIIAGAVGFLAYSQLATPAEPPPPVFVEIYIALQPISQGGEIKKELLSTIKIAPPDLVAVMYTIDEEGLLLGKIAKFPLDQGVVITESMVSDASAAVSIPGPTWASTITTGKTAITIPVDKLGLVGYGVNDGAYVNVTACFLFVDIDPSFQTILPNITASITGTGLAGEASLPVLTLGVTPAENAVQGRLELDPSLQQPYYLLPSERQRPRMVCQMILQDVLVMRVGTFPLDPTKNIIAASEPPAVTDPQAPPTAPIPPDIVTLIVSPQESVTLSYLIRTDADLALTLRNPTDRLPQPIEALTLQFLLSQYNITVPAKLPYSLEPYTIRFGNLGSGDTTENGVPNGDPAVPPQ